jgi:stage II sporulation protein D
MRRVFLAGVPALLFSILFFASLLWAQNIRVLILEDDAPQPPSGTDMVKLIDRTDGKLLLNDRPYTGKIEVWQGTGGLYLINEIPLEEYLKSVVKSETGRDWDLEALKAMAVVARTYAINQKAKNGQFKYDITSTTLHQVYNGDVQDERITEAVKDTEDEILTYQGVPIEAFYHSTCGGHTEDPEEVFGKSLPYLKGQEVKCELSPLAVWARTIPLAEFGEALGLSGVKDVRIKSYTRTGRVREVEISADNGLTIFKATDLRRILGWKRLPSTAFRLEIQDEALVIDGTGYGHGVGLCQWSALEMARDGKNYTDILSFFYPGTQLVKYGSPGL